MRRHDDHADELRKQYEHAESLVQPFQRPIAMHNKKTQMIGMSLFRVAAAVQGHVMPAVDVVEDQGPRINALKLVMGKPEDLSMYLLCLVINT